MSVIDLYNRNTNDWEFYQKHKSSSDSSIYISTSAFQLDDGQVSLILSVGDKWFMDETETCYKIADEGISVNPFETVIIETNEKIGLPYNVFGLVTGKGLKIFKGIFVSAGKINPGFCNKLRIGIYNGSKSKRILKTGDLLCSCVFFEMESTLKIPLQKHSDSSKYNIKPLGKRYIFIRWFNKNKEMIAIIISIVAVLISLFKDSI
jgi:deoxycytidine triphosphate deaminase